ncbi:hypothetical protein KEM55_001299 [Ascosphaera atra]|nr:hypothetical protein KEM55_001299 [Ascosphaera atra]
MGCLQFFRDWFAPLLSWKALAILLVALNLKNVPFAWHARVFYYMGTRNNVKKHDLVLKAKAKSKVKAEPTSADGTAGVASHPIFTPVSIFSHTPMTEMDYNLHKSNSTYFSDLDISRTALVTDLYTPGVELIRRDLDKQLDDSGRKKYPGGIFVVLGSVYCSFKKAIVAYERYEMQSKVVGWDEKWLYVVTFFLRPEKKKGQGKTLLAVGISEYVTKKGRFTISPSKVLAASGLLPPRPGGADMGVAGTSSAVDSSVKESPAMPAGGAVELPDASKVNQQTLESRRDENVDALSGDPDWTWEKIEKERKRGMELVKQFVGLEAKVMNEVKLS